MISPDYEIIKNPNLKHKSEWDYNDLKDKVKDLKLFVKTNNNEFQIKEVTEYNKFGAIVKKEYYEDGILNSLYNAKYDDNNKQIFIQLKDRIGDELIQTLYKETETKKQVDNKKFSNKLKYNFRGNLHEFEINSENQIKVYKEYFYDRERKIDYGSNQIVQIILIRKYFYDINCKISKQILSWKLISEFESIVELANMMDQLSGKKTKEIDKSVGPPSFYEEEKLTEYKYNENEDIIQIKNLNKKNSNEIESFSYTYDSKENWILKEKKVNEELFSIKKRNIIYY